MDDENFDMFGNLKNLQDEVYSMLLEKLMLTQPSEAFDEGQCLSSFADDEAKGKLNLPNTINSVLTNKKTAKTTKNKKSKTRKISGKMVPVQHQTATVNETTLDSPSISQMLYEHEQNNAFAKRLRSSLGKADVSASCITTLEETIVLPKVKAKNPFVL